MGGKAEACHATYAPPIVTPTMGPPGAPASRSHVSQGRGGQQCGGRELTCQPQPRLPGQVRHEAQRRDDACVRGGETNERDGGSGRLGSDTQAPRTRDAHEGGVGHAEGPGQVRGPPPQDENACGDGYWWRAFTLPCSHRPTYLRTRARRPGASLWTPSRPAGRWAAGLHIAPQQGKQRVGVAAPTQPPMMAARTPVTHLSPPNAPPMMAARTPVMIVDTHGVCVRAETRLKSGGSSPSVDMA